MRSPIHGKFSLEKSMFIAMITLSSRARPVIDESNVK